MQRMAMMGWAIAVCAGVAVAALVWPPKKVQAQATPQVNVEGCACSRPAVTGTGKEQIAVYFCTCPGTQCVVSATAAGTNGAPPNLAQTCR